MCWLRSLTPVTYLSKLLGIHSLAAFLQLELFRVQITAAGKRLPGATRMIELKKMELN